MMNGRMIFNHRYRLTTMTVLLEMVLLAVQYILGMWMNLFAVYPTSGFYVMRAMFDVPNLLPHIMLGFLIGIISIAILFISLSTRKLYPILLSAISSVSILVAGISGLDFIFGDFVNNDLSYLMSVFFIISVLSYSFLIYTSERGR
ncbi:MAG: hypothetical protein ACP5UV_01570 [Thermoplasmata archaeon]